MAFVKLFRHLRQYGVLSLAAKISRTAPRYLRGIPYWQLRRCGCCQRRSLFLATGSSEEFSSCVFCSANLRYELLAEELRKLDLSRLEVLELDPASPLSAFLSAAKRHQRTYYSSTDEKGMTGLDGARCEDISQLTFEDESFDVIVSSDVLEHVFDLRAALTEVLRVLRPGGVHLFTVPPRPATKARATIQNGEITYLATPEYHLDPLRREGVLATWDIGPDLPKVMNIPQLQLRIIRGPVGRDQRVVWEAKKALPNRA